MQFPFTLRLAYHSFRAVMRAGLLLLIVWIFLIPASASDNTALGAKEGTTYPAGLRMMRVAQVVVAVAPPRAYDLIAVALPQDVSPLMVRIAMTQMAAGYVLPASTRQSPVNGIESERDIAGPRFIKID